MFGILLLCLYLTACICAFGNGNAETTGAAVMEGAQAAVDFCFRTAGALCFWSAVIELMTRCGVSRALSQLLRSPLSLLFPRAVQDPKTLEALSENVSANLLGLGNAATPAGIRAAQGLAALGAPARDELAMLVVVNTASLQILPGTITAIRAAAGAASPFDIMPAVWLCSLISLAAGLLSGTAFKRLWR